MSDTKISAVSTHRQPHTLLGKGMRSRPRRGRSLQRRRQVAGAAFAAPALTLIVVFFFVPLGLTFWMSLHNWPLLGDHRFIGLENCRRALRDTEFRSALWFTLKYTLVVTPVLFLLGLALAFLIKRPRRGARFFQSVYFLPVVIGFASGAFLWLYMSQTQLGPLFDLLRRLGIVHNNTNLFADTWTALITVVAMVTWKVVGLQMLLLLAGLQSIPEDVIEAASIDGANRWQSFIHVTIPLLRPTLALVLVFSVAGSLLAFDQFYIMTNGGPSNQTITAVYEIYRASFIRFRLGYGAALSVLLMLVLAIVSAVQMMLLRNSENV